MPKKDVLVYKVKQVDLEWEREVNALWGVRQSIAFQAAGAAFVAVAKSFSSLAGPPGA
jgi:hypothetical protein